MGISDRAKHPHGAATGSVVFDQAQRKPRHLDVGRTGPRNFSGFRRCAADNVPATEVLTGKLLGDPKPGRFNFKPLWKYRKDAPQ